MLNLIEDEETIRNQIISYLQSHPVDNWKFQSILEQLLTNNLQITTQDSDLIELGNIYKEEMFKLYEEHKEQYNNSERQKIETVLSCITQICTALPIKKLVRENTYTTTYIESLQAQATTSNIKSMRNLQQISTSFSNLDPLHQAIYLCDELGKDGALDMMSTVFPRRYRLQLKTIKDRMKLHLQPMATMKEKQMLTAIAECKDKAQIDNLLEKLYAQKKLDSPCKYIRFALASISQLWESGELLKNDHGESWYRSHIYGSVWDKAFMSDKHFEIKRSEFYSNITKYFKDEKKQRVDFILRNINDDSDYISAEEKPSKKGVKSDFEKGKRLQRLMLNRWTQNLPSDRVVQHLEAITCQWEATKLTIFATRPLSKNHTITYRKGSFVVPKTEKHAAEFAKLLLAVLSL